MHSDVNDRNDPKFRLCRAVMAFCILLQLLALATVMVVESRRSGSESTFESPKLPGMPERQYR